MGGKKFLSGLMGFAHIFSTSTYFFRIWVSTVSVACRLQVVYADRVGTDASKYVADTPLQRQHKVALLRFLLQAALQKHRLSDRMETAIVNLVTILNTSWRRDLPTHVCQGS